MDQNENSKPKKMNGCLKIILIFFGVCFLLGIVGKLSNLDKQENNSKTTNNNPLIEKLEKVSYSDLNLEERKEVLNYFIQGEYQFEDKNFLLNQNINNAISKYLKFPETLEIKGFDNEYHKDYEGYTRIEKDATNVNYDEGTFDVIREFKAEGSVVGIKVRKKAIFSLKLKRFGVVIENILIK